MGEFGTVDKTEAGELPNKCRSARLSKYNFIRDLCLDDRYADGKYCRGVNCNGYKEPKVWKSQNDTKQL